MKNTKLKKTNKKSKKNKEKTELETEIPKIKLMVLGESMVGKTALIVRFTEKKFENMQMSTVGIDKKQKNILIKGVYVTLNIWDTAGQERYQYLPRQYYKNAEGILLVFSLQDEYSFSKMPYWLKSIYSNADKDIPVVLIGNKSDLTPKKINDENIQKFCQNAKEEFRKEIEYFEVSALTGENVDDVFLNIAGKIIEKKKLFQNNEDKLKEDDKIDDLKGHESIILKKEKVKKKKNCCS